MQLHAPFRVITPTLDGDVLSALALADDSFTVAQLQRMIRGSDEGLRKVLRRLNAQGIVDVETYGSTSAYRLNREHLAAESVIALATMKSQLCNRIETVLQGWSLRPEYAAVFGWAGGGEMTESSDIDLLLISPDGVEPGSDNQETWDSQVDELVRAIARWTGNDARVLEFRASDVRTDREPVFSDVVSDGLTVFGPTTWLRSRLRTDGDGRGEQRL